ERAQARSRHARAVAALFARADDDNRDGEVSSEVHGPLLRPELGNMRAAYGWARASDGDLEVAVTLASCAAALDDFGAECVDWLLALRRQVADDGSRRRSPRALLARSGGLDDERPDSTRPAGGCSGSRGRALSRARKSASSLFSAHPAREASHLAGRERGRQACHRRGARAGTSAMAGDAA